MGSPLLLEEIAKEAKVEHILGRSRAAQLLRHRIEIYANDPKSTVVVGETGVGKELVARELHERSQRKGKFIPVDCGSLSPQLLASELFGHVRGAFTGASDSSRGLLYAAEGGTLFLDEICNLAPEAQRVLLRLLDTRKDGKVEYRPVGSIQVQYANTTLLFATNRTLEELESSGTFNSDFLYRLKGKVLEVPPLRERDKDVIYLAGAFFLEFAELFKIDVREIREDALDTLLAHTWPGNVRELRNVVESTLREMRVNYTFDGEAVPDYITAEDLMIGGARKKARMTGVSGSYKGGKALLIAHSAIAGYEGAYSRNSIKSICKRRQEILVTRLESKTQPVSVVFVTRENAEYFFHEGKNAPGYEQLCKDIEQQGIDCKKPFKPFNRSGLAKMCEVSRETARRKTAEGLYCPKVITSGSLAACVIYEDVVDKLFPEESYNTTRKVLKSSIRRFYHKVFLPGMKRSS